jgi:hypothetical protein
MRRKENLGTAEWQIVEFEISLIVGDSFSRGGGDAAKSVCLPICFSNPHLRDSRQGASVALTYHDISPIWPGYWGISSIASSSVPSTGYRYKEPAKVLSTESRGSSFVHSSQIKEAGFISPSGIAALRDVGSHRKMIVHADNAVPHAVKCVTEYLQHNSLKKTPHPP